MKTARHSTGERKRGMDTNNFMDVFDNLQDGVYFVDLDREITYWNAAAEELTGFSAREVMGKKCMDNLLVHIDERGAQLCQGQCPLAAAMGDGIPRQAEVYLHHKRGHRVPVLVRAIPLRNAGGRVVGGVEMFMDISTRKAMLERIRELEKLALVDGLTGLSNRQHLIGELESRFHEKTRYGLSFGILFMDIDHFKKVNDTYGHSVGDLTLKTVSDTLRAAARSYDLFGRWGGEEFMGIIRNVDRPLLGKIGDRFRMLVEKTRIHCEQTAFSVTISVGAALAMSKDTPERLVERADALLYRSKADGRNRMTLDA